MHKTTRSAEMMLAELLRRLGSVIANGDGDASGLPERHPLRRYYSEDGRHVAVYLQLDDAIVWGALTQLENSSDEVISELAS